MSEDRGSIHRRSVRVRLADLPGALHLLTGLVAEVGVNIVRLEVVSHEQPDVWDDLELTAVSQAKLDAAISSLRQAGVMVIGLPASWAIRDWSVDVLRALEAFADTDDPADIATRFATTARSLVNLEHSFVLMEPLDADASAAEARWAMIQQAAEAFDPEVVKWSGDPMGVRIVTSAMRAARHGARFHGGSEPGVGAVLRVPLMASRPAHLVVVGRRPPLLDPELRRLQLFARVAAPHLSSAALRATA